jgi:TP53 regulating kinase and related kinases
MTKQKQIASGAEAIIYLQESSNNISPKKSNNKTSPPNNLGQEEGEQRTGGRGEILVIKHRISKSYRHPTLDKQIIKRRTKAETKILKMAAKIIPTPIPQDQKENDKIIMPFIDGDKLSQTLDSYDKPLQKKIMFQIGKSTAKLHKAGIIHGDLTTSNMIFKDTEIFLIDFGLGFLNGKYEDKGVDIHLLKQALEAKHFRRWKILFNQFEKGYKSIEPLEAEKVLDKLISIEKRGRYKH